jgi:hypothetical protein
MNSPKVVRKELKARLSQAIQSLLLATPGADAEAVAKAARKTARKLARKFVQPAGSAKKSTVQPEEVPAATANPRGEGKLGQEKRKKHKAGKEKARKAMLPAKSPSQLVS